MKKMKIRAALIASLILTLSGCAAPAHVQKQASEILTGACLAMFLEQGPYKYQAAANMGRAAFAVAIDPTSGQMVCGKATNYYGDVADGLFISLPPMDRLEAVAIKRCEQIKPSTLKAPCRLYAKGNDIVWGKDQGLM